VALLTAEGIYQWLQAQRAGIKGLNGVLAKPFLLGTIPKLSLLVVGKERQVIVVL